MTSQAAHTYEFPCALHAMTMNSFRAVAKANGLHILKARTNIGPNRHLSYAAIVRRERRRTHLCSIWHVVGKGDNAIASPVTDNGQFYYPERTPH